MKFSRFEEEEEDMLGKAFKGFLTKAWTFGKPFINCYVFKAGNILNSNILTNLTFSLLWFYSSSFTAKEEGLSQEAESARVQW